MNYIGITDCYWLFVNNIGQVYGVSMNKCVNFGEAYEKAFVHFFG